MTNHEHSIAETYTMIYINLCLKITKVHYIITNETYKAYNTLWKSYKAYTNPMQPISNL